MFAPGGIVLSDTSEFVRNLSTVSAIVKEEPGASRAVHVKEEPMSAGVPEEQKMELDEPELTEEKEEVYEKEVVYEKDEEDKKFVRIISLGMYCAHFVGRGSHSRTARRRWTRCHSVTPEAKGSDRTKDRGGEAKRRSHSRKSEVGTEAEAPGAEVERVYGAGNGRS